MRKLLLLLVSVSFLSLNAQIFINTNPNSKGNSGTVVKENKTVDKTKKELNTTKTEVENVEPVLTSPNYNNSRSSTSTKVETNVSGSSNTSSSATISGTTTTKTSGTSVSGTTTTNSGSNVSGTTTSSSNVSGTSSSNSIKSSSTSSMAASGDVPPNAQPGKCYARCQTEDQYTYKAKQVVASPRMVKKIKLPALYTTVYDTVVIRQQSKKFENVAAQYETVREQKMTAPSTTKWVKGKADAGCLSADPNDCQVMCLVEVPAQYTTITKRVLKHKAYKRETNIPMEYKIVAKQIKTQNERYAEQVIPATYKTIQERVLVSKGGYQGWKEVLCGNDLTTQKITQIQKALKAAGYNPGPIDNIFGSQTKEALKAYQRAKGLPVGNLNIETLKSLGVN